MTRLYVNLINAIHDAQTNERGAAGVEYGIMVAAIAAVIAATAFLIGGKVSAAFSTVLTSLNGTV